MNQVLVIDDSVVQRQMMRQALEARGYMVLEAADGAEGFDALLRNPQPLVVLFDYQMPVMDGFALLQMVAGDATILARHAFILATACEESQLPVLFLQLLTRLATPVLLKPVPVDLLQETVRIAAARLPAAADALDRGSTDRVDAAGA